MAPTTGQGSPRVPVPVPMATPVRQVSSVPSSALKEPLGGESCSIMHQDARGTLKALVGSHAVIQEAHWACSLMSLPAEVAPTSRAVPLFL